MLQAQDGSAIVSFIFVQWEEVYTCFHIYVESMSYSDCGTLENIYIHTICPLLCLLQSHFLNIKQRPHGRPHLTLLAEFTSRLDVVAVRINRSSCRQWCSGLSSGRASHQLQASVSLPPNLSALLCQGEAESLSLPSASRDSTSSAVMRSPGIVMSLSPRSCAGGWKPRRGRSKTSG